jgi:phosphoribosylaminoimidazole-succinocarboxamide synthase
VKQNVPLCLLSIADSFLDFQTFFDYYAPGSRQPQCIFAVPRLFEYRQTVARRETVPPQKYEITLAKQTRVPIHEGAEKILYQSDNPDFLIMEFKGGTDGRKKSSAKSPSTLRNEISSYLFEYLEGFQVDTHFVKKLSDVEMMVKRLRMYPIVVKVFNVATGSLGKRLELKEGSTLTFPILECVYKNRDLGFPWINESHAAALNIATTDEFRALNRLASKINAILRALCERRDLILAAISLEFGRHKGQILLGDELSPSTCLFWDKSARTKAEREKYRMNTPNAEEALKELSSILQRKG